MIKIKRIEGIEINIPWWLWLMLIVAIYALLSGNAEAVANMITHLLSHFSND